jgi:hypothetical protein
LRPTTAFRPTWKKVWPYLVALFCLDDLRREVLQTRGEPAVEHAGRLYEVVVRGEQRVADRSRLGIVLEAVRLALAPVQPDGVRHARKGIREASGRAEGAEPL